MSNPLSTSLYDDQVDVIVSGGPVSIGLLRGVLKLTEDPNKILLFHNDRLASACVKLVQKRSKVYPILDDEFGFLCLKVIVFCVQVATLVMCGTMYAFIEEAPPQPDPNFTLAKCAVASLCDLIPATAVTGPEFATRPFLAVADAVTLIECLYRQRHRFLFYRCASPELSGGWSFILYPAWIHLLAGHISDQNTMARVLGDLACRFAAGEFKYNAEASIVESMAESSYIRSRDVAGTNRGYFLNGVDDQDSELAVTRVSTRLLTGPVTMKLAYYLDLWAGNRTNSNRPDLMLMFLKASLTRLWRALDSWTKDLPLTRRRLREIVQLLEAIILYLSTVVAVNFAIPNIAPQVVRQHLVGAAFEYDIFCLIARTLLFPLPWDYTSLGGAHHMFEHHFQAVDEFSGILSSFYPFGMEIQEYCYVDWLRAAQRFGERCHMHEERQFVQTYVSRCRAAWKKLGSSFFGKHIDVSVACAYPRCPHPTSSSGVLSTCGGCRAVAYCSHRCQRSHWIYDLPEGPHVEACSSSTLTLMKR
ncbi:hypothetical protein FRC08_017419 [Ceratobasidium sp. 394]|nr:hypothetical protein FRC08_017419 [Ceratobasidium sp. 394]